MVTAAGLAITAALVLVSIVRVADDRFGESHDGRNGAMWAAQAEALRDDPVASRFGARFVGDEVYANHPPLIVLETALTQAIGGDGRAASRAPAYLGSIVALVLLWRIARGLGLSQVATAWGLAVATSSQLFVGYLAMLDTPMTSLPFALLLLERTLAVLRRPEHPRPWVLAPLAALAATAGWQALLFSGLLGIGLVLDRRRRLGAFVLAGAAAGLTMVVSWQLWVYGSLDNLSEQLRARSGSELLEQYGGGPIQAYERQLDWITSLTNPVALLAGAAGIWLLVRDRGASRLAAATTTFAVAAYVALLPGAAGFHDYWSYWILVPCTLGVARVAEWAWRAVQPDRPEPGRDRPPLVPVLVAGILLVAPVYVLVTTGPSASTEAGLAAAALAARADAPPARGIAAGDPRYWAWYEHDRSLPVPELCDSGPDCIVLVRIDGLRRLGYAVDELPLIDRQDDFALVTADDLRRAQPADLDDD